MIQRAISHVTSSSKPPSAARLTPLDHDRDSAGLRYVYPVVSRRAGGVSVGINLNVNNACNWRCIYCQVPDLARGAPPPVDLRQLRAELEGFLDDVLRGDFLEKRVDVEARRLNDIALSGNGEPTSAAEFEQVVQLIGDVREAARVPEEVKTILITNGSLVHKSAVQAGISRLRALNGEVWFKIDRGTSAGMRAVNDSSLSPRKAAEHLKESARLCPTWVQTCMFACDGLPPDEEELRAYLDFLGKSIAAGARLEGVLLYSLARPSLQPEAGRLKALPTEWLEALAGRIRALGLTVRVTP